MTGPQEAPQPQEQRPPTQEEMEAMLADRLARTPVRDVLLQCMATFVDMAGVRLGMGPAGNEARDLPQARQAIEALRALLAVAEQELGAAQVQAVQGAARRPPDGLLAGRARSGRTRPPREAPPTPPPAPDAASRLWVPPGTPRTEGPR